MRDSRGRFAKGNVPYTKGRKRTPEERRKMSEGVKKAYAEGRLVPWNKGKTGVQSSWNKGLKKEFDERLKKKAEAQKGFKHTEEAKRKMSETKKRLFKEGKIKIWCEGKTFTDKKYYSPRFNNKIKPKVLRRDKFTCQRCKKVPHYPIVHHIKPIKDGGTHNLSNLMTVCQSCHRLIHNGRAIGFEYEKLPERKVKKKIRDKTYKKVDISNKICQKCGVEHAKERHHQDYNKPEEVMLLCIKCHKEEHYENI